MRATTAAAAAVLLGSVSADWESWSGSSTDVDSKTPVLETTYSKPTTDPATSWTETAKDSTDASDNWGTWSTTTSSSADPSTWSEWSSTSSTPAVETSTSTDPDYTWSEWSTSSSSADPSTWSEWTSTTSTSADPTHTWGAWSSSSSADPTSSSSWSEWSSASKSSDPSTTWSAWDPKTTVTSTSTQWITVTVFPVDGGNTWSQWSSDDATTTTDTNTVVVSSTITKTGTWADWSASASASATPVAAFDPQCKLEISVSYGAPVWYPTPVIATSANSTAWGEWDGAASSSTPAASSSVDYTWAVWTAASSSDSATSTDPSSWSAWDGASSTDDSAKSTVTSSTWSEWEGSSSSDSATSTDPSSWSAWDGASSTDDSAKSTVTSSTWSAWDGSSSPAVSTSTADASSWTNWGSSASQTQGGAFYTASASGSWGSQSSGSSNSGSWSTGSSGITSNGNKFGMTYSPYTSNGGCKDQGTVTADIAEIAAKGFTSVRVYSTDCSTLEFVGGAAKSNGLKVILGVFISDTGISGAQPQVDAIAKWAQWDLVELIVVGNEAVFNNRCSASDLAGFIGSSKKAFQAAGYKGAISTTDELSVWQGQGSAWCDVVDVVSANLYAFFNPNTAAEDAGSFIQNQIQDLSSVCPGKEVYVMESGWPSAGECNGKACPSPENQATAIKGIQSTSGAKVVFFSFEDEQWKQPGQFGVEQHWGCGSVFSN